MYVKVKYSALLQEINSFLKEIFLSVTVKTVFLEFVVFSVDTSCSSVRSIMPRTRLEEIRALFTSSQLDGV